MYNPKLPYTVYSYEHYYSDEWDRNAYAMDYDPARPFLEQFGELLRKVPKCAVFKTLAAGPNIRSDYANYCGALKDSYMVFNAGPLEECMYSRGIRDSRQSVDMYFGIDNEHCYECVNVQKSSGVLWSKNVSSCLDSAFLENTSGCTNCFGSVNIRNKTHVFLNEQLSKEAYEERVKKILGSYAEIENFKKKFAAHRLTFPHRSTSNLKTQDSTGDYLFECKNVRDSFEVTRSEDCRYLFSSKEIKDSYGTTGYGFGCERVLECAAVGYSQNLIGCALTDRSQDCAYSVALENCSNCFGCTGVKHLHYAILNKEYGEAEYKVLREKIIDELKKENLYGLPLAPSLAPFAYNETNGQDNFPMTKEEILAAGFRYEEDISVTVGKETITLAEIPDHIRDVTDSITQEILKCIHCERNYKITEQELLFYRRMLVPIPHQCFFCRHQDRILRRGPYQFWKRVCTHCQKEMMTNFAPDRPEIVYCESC